MGAQPQMIEQMAATQTTPPPPSKDKGYGHGVTLDSMIVTPRVPTLVEESINVGTEEETETSTETSKEFAATTPFSNKISYLNQFTVTKIHVVAVAAAMEKEFQNIKQERTEFEKLTEGKLEKIKSLESQLNQEKVTSTQLCQNLDTANEELQRLRKEKEMNDRSCP